MMVSSKYQAMKKARFWLENVRLTSAVAGPSRSLQTIVPRAAYTTIRNGKTSLSPLIKTGNQKRQQHSSSKAHSPTRKACSKCGTPLPLSELSCISCGTLQALPTSLDAYDLLGIDIASIGANGWQVDLGELKTLWRKRVALSHPDRMGGKDEKEQQIAAQQSALINKAYETIREPLQRAHLLLEKHASSAPSEAESLEDPNVLMEVMELREGLEDAASEEEAAEVRERNKANLDESIRTLKEAFASDPINVEKARTAAVGLRYWTNIDKAAREWQPGKRVELKH